VLFLLKVFKSGFSDQLSVYLIYTKQGFFEQLWNFTVSLNFRKRCLVFAHFYLDFRDLSGQVLQFCRKVALNLTCEFD